MRFLRLLVWPQEVTELTEGKKRKIIGENLGFFIFELERDAAPQKNPWNISNLDFKYNWNSLLSKFKKKKLGYWTVDKAGSFKDTKFQIKDQL